MKGNLPVINIEQFNKIIRLQFEEGNKRPIFGLGKGGIGKTESIAELAKNMGIGYIDIRLLLYAETDLKGIPYPDSTSTRTIWLQNNILPIEERDGKNGILVLDEITSVSRSVRTAAYQLLNERRLGEYVLPDGWIIVALGNGENDGGDFNGMEGNFANRCSIFNVVPDIEIWKQWAYKEGINYLSLAYLSWRPGDLHTFEHDSEEMLFASPRSWKAVSDILNSHPFNKDDTINNLRIISNIGPQVGNQFIAFCKYKESAIEPLDIINGNYNNKENINLEVLFMTMHGVIKLMYDSIKADFSNYKGFTEETMKKCANGIRWILNLNAMEHRVMGIKDFVATDRQLVVQLFLNKQFSTICPELITFANENQSIFRR